MIKYIVLLCLLITTQVTVANAEEYIQVVKGNVNIRTAASSDAEIVGQAAKGMVFTLVDTKDNWYEVVFPSGEYRYIHSSLGTTIDDAPQLTDSEALLSPACSDFIQAEHRATAEAEAIEPDIMKQIDIARLLVDKYKLEVFETHNISPARRTELTLWCATH